MRTIEEIKYDLRTTGEIIDDRSLNRIPFEAYTHKYKELKCELYEALTDGIPLDRLEMLCQAEREQRCMVIPKPMTVSDVEMLERIGLIVKNLTDMENFMKVEAAEAAKEGERNEV